MEFLSRLVGRFYILLLYCFAMMLGAVIFSGIGNGLLQSKSNFWVSMGGAMGLCMVRPLRKRLAKRYGLKDVQEAVSNEEADEMLHEACKLEVAGKIEEACSKYQEVVRTFPGTRQARDAEKEIAILKRS